ncbi:hypothetical protein ACNKHK_14630 [Shigella flexneri]
MTAMLFTMAVGLNVVSMAAKAKAAEEEETDVLLIGGGIMSATLGPITGAGAAMVNDHG